MVVEARAVLRRGDAARCITGAVIQCQGVVKRVDETGHLCTLGDGIGRVAEDGAAAHCLVAFDLVQTRARRHQLCVLCRQLT